MANLIVFPLRTWFVVSQMFPLVYNAESWKFSFFFFLNRDGCRNTEMWNSTSVLTDWFTRRRNFLRFSFLFKVSRAAFYNNIDRPWADAGLGMSSSVATFGALRYTFVGDGSLEGNKRQRHYVILYILNFPMSRIVKICLNAQGRWLSRPIMLFAPINHHFSHLLFFFNSSSSYFSGTDEAAS